MENEVDRLKNEIRLKEEEIERFEGMLRTNIEENDKILRNLKITIDEENLKNSEVSSSGEEIEEIQKILMKREA